jgi:hypothetical protein
MTIAQGLNKKIIVKKEATWGTASGPAGGEVIRRLTSSFNLVKEKYTSAEIRTDKQVVNSNHGMKSVTGSLNGELSPGTYSELFEALYMRDFTAGVSSTAVDLTIAASGDNWTVTRATGSYLTTGFKIGSTIRLSVGVLNALNINKNLVIVALTATVATVKVLNGSAMFAQGPIVGCTVTEIGYKTFAPATGHTDQSFTVEEFFGDISQSHVYTGNKIGSGNISLPATGLVSCDFSTQGKDQQVGVAQYFTAPAVQTTSKTFASTSGTLLVDGVESACVTSLTLNQTKALTAANCVGKTTADAIFTDALVVSGSATVYFENAVVRDLFNNETEFGMIVTVATSEAAAADFITVTLPRCKANSFTVDDSSGALSATVEFEALRNTAGGVGIATEDTTVSMQDSLI